MRQWLISPLDKTHDRKSFVCGLDSLDNYFQRQAGQDSQKRIAVTYVLHDQKENKIAGYYSLSATAIELSTLPEGMRKKLPYYPDLPATLIGRLAVDETYKQRGLGKLLLIDAIKRAYHTSLAIASFAVVVAAIDSSAEKFYKKYGFLDLSVAKKHCLFLPMHTIEKL